MPSNAQLGRNGALSNDKPTARTISLLEAATRAPEHILRRILVIRGSVLVGYDHDLVKPGKV